MAERQRAIRADEMATTSTAVTTVPPQASEEPVERVAVITLRPNKQQTRKKVVWTEDTVDNEHMNKKKSKCCCIYEKPRRFDESESESDDECEHCFGHVERRNKRPGASTSVAQEPTEPAASVTLKPAAPAPSPSPAPPDKTPADT